MSDGLAATCAEHGYVLEERLDGHSSVFVARVRDRRGTRLLLKSASAAQLDRECRCLELWRASPHVPRLVARLSEDLMVREWVQGRGLGDHPVEDAELHQVGQALAAMHRTPVGSQPLPAIRDWMRAETPAGEPAPPAAGPPVALHGDAYPANLLVAEHGVVAIDPAGYLGDAAFDLACVVVMLPVERPEESLEPLLAGYGGRPALIDEYLAWLAVRAARRFVGDHGLARPAEHWAGMLRRLGLAG